MLGYPAVFANDVVDRVDNGHCVLYVGVADDLAFYTAMQTHGEPPMREACDIAKRSATAAVRKLQQG